MYIKELAEGWYACIDPDTQLGFGLAWPKEIYPYLWFWLVYGKSPGYPWWDRTYCIALEPWTSYPNRFDEADPYYIKELRKHPDFVKAYDIGIRVNAIAPGFFDTMQTAVLFYEQDGITPTPRLHKIIEGTPMKKLDGGFSSCSRV